MDKLKDYRRWYVEAPLTSDIPTINVYDADYIKENIRVLKSNPIRNRFRIGRKVRLIGMDTITHEPTNVTACYLLGELCMNRRPQFYTSSIKSLNYIIFEDEAVVSGARNYVKNRYVEVEILYRIDDDYQRGWFRVERVE